MKKLMTKALSMDFVKDTQNRSRPTTDNILLGTLKV